MRVYYYQLTKLKSLQKKLVGITIMNVEEEAIVTNPASASNRHPITQDLIDDVLSNELKDFSFPVKPQYNPRINDNGRTVSSVLGQSKELKRIEIGKQDKPSREFLIDTLLHEYYEAEIITKRLDNELYWNLDRAIAVERHKWINAKTSEFFENRGVNNELG